MWHNVFISNEIFEDCLIINVEAYDDFGYEMLNTTVEKFDEFYSKLNGIIFTHFKQINNKTDKVRVCIYSDVYPTQYILTNEGERY